MFKISNNEFLLRLLSSVFLISFLILISIIGNEAYKICTILLSYLLLSELEMLIKKKRFLLFFQPF
jgi:hypothetical protein